MVYWCMVQALIFAASLKLQVTIYIPLFFKRILAPTNSCLYTLSLEWCKELERANAPTDTMSSAVRLLLSASLCYGYVELESSCLKSYPYPPNQNKSRTLCVQPLLCPKANLTHVRVITEAEVQQQEVPGGGVVLYTAGTSEVSCIECAREVCSLINGSLPVITSQEDNKCVLGGGSVGTKARIPLAARNLDNRGWDWPYLPGLTVEGEHEYSNWAGGAVPPGIPSVDLCATMNSAGVWASTPCDMSAYHTQKDFIVCAVQMHLPSGEEADSSESSSGSGSGSGHRATSTMYIVIPTVVTVLVLGIITWRKKMDSGNSDNASDNEVAAQSFNFFKPPHLDENIQKDEKTKGDTSKSTDENGYLVPRSLKMKSISSSPVYYEAINGEEDEDGAEPMYDQVNGLLEEARGGNDSVGETHSYDVAIGSNSVVPNSTYVYDEEHNNNDSEVLLGSDSDENEDENEVERTYSVPHFGNTDFNLESTNTDT